MHDLLMWTAWGVVGILLSALSRYLNPGKIQK